MSACGVVVRRPGRDAEEAGRRGLATVASPEWPLQWERTLFVSGAAHVPWDLIGSGFSLISRWDVAAPLAGVLAEDLGSPADRERTRAVMFDLRIPAYAHELLFVRYTDAGRAWLAAWREECAGGADERLAFLRALARVKPLFCPLPRVWALDASHRARYVAQERALGVTTPNPRRPTSTERAEAAARARALARRRRGVR